MSTPVCSNFSVAIITVSLRTKPHKNINICSKSLHVPALRPALWNTKPGRVRRIKHPGSDSEPAVCDLGSTQSERLGQHLHKRRESICTHRRQSRCEGYNAGVAPVCYMNSPNPAFSPALLWALMLFNLLYVLLFSIHFLEKGNAEFMLYSIQMLFIIGIITVLYLRFHFSMTLLLGATLWGLLHMLGGSTLLTGEGVLYDLVLLPLFQTGDAVVLGYDQLMHFYCYLVVAAMLHHIFRSRMRVDGGRLTPALLTLLAAMGVGAVNEIIEFIPVLTMENTGVGGYYNTLWDLVFNTLGATAAVTYLSLRKEMPSS